jgi:phospholipid transport system substrate-binding protein
MRSVQLLIIFLLASFLSIELSANEITPDKIVKETVDQVLIVLKDKNLDDEQKKNKTFALVKEHIHFKEMSRRILATNWNVATEEQKTEFISLFEQILLNTYWLRIKRYAGERVEYISVSSDNDGYATVDTIILRFNNNIEIPISYRMKRFVNIWFAYDFTVERLSLVQSYRNEYRATIKNFGIDGLLEQMKNEIASYTSNT